MQFSIPTALYLLLSASTAVLAAPTVEQTTTVGTVQLVSDSSLKLATRANNVTITLQSSAGVRKRYDIPIDHRFYDFPDPHPQVKILEKWANFDNVDCGIPEPHTVENFTIDSNDNTVFLNEFVATKVRCG